MRVFNLTSDPVIYRRVAIPGFGSFDYPDLGFVPSRDQKLQDAGVLAFGSLPLGWTKPVPQPTPEPEPVVVAPMKAEIEKITLEDSVAVTDSVSVSLKDSSLDKWRKKK